MWVRRRPTFESIKKGNSLKGLRNFKAQVVGRSFANFFLSDSDTNIIP